MLRRRHTVILVLGCLLLGTFGFVRHRYRTERLRICDPATLPLAAARDGDLIFSAGHSFKSDLVRIAASRYRSDFSHVGFLRHRNGAWSVVHMSIDDGCLLEEPLGAFLRRNRVCSVGIGRLRRAPAPERINRTLDSLLQSGKAFDYDFDLQNDDAYYCTELIIKALSDSGASLRARVSPTGILYPAALLDPETLTLINP